MRLLMILVFSSALYCEIVNISDTTIDVPFVSEIVSISDFNDKFPGVEEPMVLLQDESGKITLSFSETVVGEGVSNETIKRSAMDTLTNKYPNARGKVFETVNIGKLEVVRVEYTNIWTDDPYRSVAILFIVGDKLKYLTIRVAEIDLKSCGPIIEQVISSVRDRTE